MNTEVLYEEKKQLIDELGLDVQAKVLETQKEIDAITQYGLVKEVSYKDLENIFGIDNEKNLKKYQRDIRIEHLSVIAAGLCLFVGFISGLIIIAPKPSVAEYIEMARMTVWIGFLAPVFVWCSIYFSKNMPTHILLQHESLKKYEGTIPYGGLLKIKEVVDKKMFKLMDLIVITPSIASSDPAIIGIKNNKKYMIFAWDMDKDMEKLKIS